MSDAARRVASRALVLHARDDAVVPFAEGRRLATLIPDARFVPLESRNHILLAHEPAWPAFLAELHRFLGVVEPAPRVAMSDALSARELEVLALVAAGLPTRRSRRGCTSARAPSSATSPTST